MPQTRSDTRDRIIDAALALIAVRGWHRTGLGDIAKAAGLTLAQLHRHFPDRSAILLAHLARIDEAMLKGRAPRAETPRERLAEVVMRRFALLNPYRNAHRALRRDLIADPVTGLRMLCHLRRSLRWMLEAAGIDSAGLIGEIRLKGLSAIYLATLCVWFSDDSEDLARTRTALDEHLARAERLARWLPRREPDGGEGDTAASPT